MHAVALAARQLAHLLLLVRALEVEGADIGAGVHLALGESDDVVAARDFLPHGLLVVERVARLVDIAELNRLADLDRTGIRLLLAGDHAEEGRLAGAVRPDHADDAAGRQLERELVDQEPLAVALRQIDKVDDVLAEPLGHGNDDLRGGRRLLGLLLDEFVVSGEAGLGGGRYPLALLGKSPLARYVLPALLLEALLLLFEPGRIIALIRNAAAAIELEYPAGHVVEEVAVVGDDEDRARVGAQMAFEPVDRFGVEMVGRLVEQQQVRLFQQQSAERDAAPLAARKRADVGIVRRAAERVHRLLDLTVEIP